MKKKNHVDDYSSLLTDFICKLRIIYILCVPAIMLTVLDWCKTTIHLNNIYFESKRKKMKNN